MWNILWSIKRRVLHLAFSAVVWNRWQFLWGQVKEKNWFLNVTWLFALWLCHGAKTILRISSWWQTFPKRPDQRTGWNLRTCGLMRTSYFPEKQSTGIVNAKADNYHREACNWVFFLMECLDCFDQQDWTNLQIRLEYIDLSVVVPRVKTSGKHNRRNVHLDVQHKF